MHSAIEQWIDDLKMKYQQEIERRETAEAELEELREDCDI